MPDGVLVGVPAEAVGKVKAAGVLMHVRLNTGGALIQSTLWSQTSAGVVYAGLGAKAGVSHLLSGNVAGVRYGSVFPS